jgi:hypothetical protein
MQPVMQLRVAVAAVCLAALLLSMLLHCCQVAAPINVKGAKPQTLAWPLRGGGLG